MAEGKRIFLYGCLGCLGIVVLVVVVGAIFSGVAWMQASGEQVEREVATQDIPRTASAAPADSARPSAPPEVGLVRLDLAQAEFGIEPLPPGEPIRVESTYDTKSYELTESLTREEGAGWTYDVRFRSKGGNWMAGLRQIFGGTPPKVRIYLPSDVPLLLDITIAEGGAKVNLGGMWFTELDLKVEKCGLRLEIDEPLRHPAERISLRGSMGGIQTSQLGNASPRRLEVDFSMGGLVLGLRGQWLNDSDIDIRSSLGGTGVRLPEDVIVLGLPVGEWRAPDESEIPPPTLRFTTSSSMGELEIIR